jgi:hypothetical protein
MHYIKLGDALHFSQTNIIVHRLLVFSLGASSQGMAQILVLILLQKFQAPFGTHKIG